VLQRGAAQNPQQLKSALTSMHGESLRLNKLVEDLLLLTKFDRDAELRRSDIGLNNLLEELTPHLLMLGGSRKLTVNADPKLRGFYDADKLKQVVLNLFHNAVQHTHPVSGEITLLAQPSSDKRSLLLSVSDNGFGMEPEHLEHIFERFYRSDSSRTRKSGGAGLGLAITRSIVEAHGGTIQATSKKGVGSTFTIRMPL
jgi:two-component system OmpR family sensor kinase